MTATARTPRTSSLRRLLGVAVTLVLTTAVLAGILAAGVVASSRGLHHAVPAGDTSPASLRYAEPATSAGPTSAGPVTAPHGRRLVVAFVAGEKGTIASDLLAPYDVFASSPAFTTYVVAHRSAPVPLEGGPAVVPAHSFADVDAHPALKPDLVVVPALSRPTDDSEAPLRDWVSREHRDGARILGVCAGSLVLATTGMLDGLHATSHWSRISALEASRPAVHWVRGRRWVEDGTVTTTAAVTSGVPAALHLVAELVGPAEAQRLADQHPELGWSPTQRAEIPADHFSAGDWPVGLDFVMPWLRPTIGIALRDGVSELDATAAFEVYTQSAAGGTVALAAGDTVRTRHGLTLLTTSYAHAPRLSRVVVPGAGAPDAPLRAWATDRGLRLEVLTAPAGRGGSHGGGFSAALANLAEHTDAATASSTAKMIGYPTAGIDLGSRHHVPRTLLLTLAALVLAGMAGIAPARLLRRRRVAA